MGTESDSTEQLELALENALLEIHQLERTVMAYKESSQVLLFDRIGNFVTELKHVQKCAEHLNIEIPGEVISLVDESRNPDLFTREFLERCLAKNEATKGRVDAFKELRGHLLDNLDEAFPEETQAYRDLRSAAADKLEKVLGREQERQPNIDGNLPSTEDSLVAEAKAEPSDIRNQTEGSVPVSDTMNPDTQQRRVKPKLEPPG